MCAQVIGVSVEVIPKRFKALMNRLESFESVKRWKLRVYTKRSRSLHTLSAYYPRLDKFWRFTDLNPDQMVEEYQKAIDSGRRVDFESKIDAFTASYVESRKLVEARYIHAVLSSFFKASGIAVETDPPKDSRSYLEVGTPMPTDEEFQAMYEQGCLDLRDKFLLVFLRQTGVRAGAIEKLKLKDVKDLVLDDKTGEPELRNDFPSIVVYAGEPEAYVTFLAPDGAQLMKQYLKWRMKGKTIHDKKGKIERLGERLTPDSPMFAKITSRKSGALGIGSAMARSLIESIVGRAGLGRRISPQGLRRLCQNLLERGGVHPNRIEAIMGHRLGLKAHYSMGGMTSNLQQKIEELRSEYKKAESHMRVSPKQGLSEDDVRRQVILENARLTFAHRPEILKQIEEAVKVRMRVRDIHRLLQDASEEEEPKHRLRQRDRKTSRDSACTDGTHCQRIVAEEELEEYLAQGFRVQLVLPSGKVVVESTDSA